VLLLPLLFILLVFVLVLILLVLALSDTGDELILGVSFTIPLFHSYSVKYKPLVHIVVLAVRVMVNLALFMITVQVATSIQTHILVVLTNT
jgi:hypothetical protein